WRACRRTISPRSRAIGRLSSRALRPAKIGGRTASCSRAPAMRSVLAVEEPDLLVLHPLLFIEGEEASAGARGELLDGGVEAAGEVDAQCLRLAVLYQRRAGVLEELPLAGGERRRGAAAPLDDVERPEVTGVQAFVVAVRLEDDVAPAARDARHAVEPRVRYRGLRETLPLLEDEGLVVAVARATARRVQLGLALRLPGDELAPLADLHALVRCRAGARGGVRGVGDLRERVAAAIE